MAFSTDLPNPSARTVKCDAMQGLCVLHAPPLSHAHARRPSTSSYAIKAGRFRDVRIAHARTDKVGQPIDDHRHGVAGIINEQFVATHVWRIVTESLPSQLRYSSQKREYR